ncbi:MAG TPA: gas vesicle protein GvpD P-loop domain-containing protein [Candidatus Bathyarchaeia archaeon]|nr:gas vesicle protein GvpD P-loop domain-containing protein [Candidatus Bathyarchaeia archaeon]
MIYDEIILIASATKPDPQALDSSIVRATSSPVMNMFLEFLEVPGNVLLIQGPPGTGKTTLALEILNAIRDTHRVYASSRVSPVKLRIQFPWIDEVIDSMSGRSSKASWNDEFHDLRGSDTDSVFSKIVRLKQTKQRSILAVDSWEGALRNATPEGRKMLESAVMSELDQTKVSVLLVSEAERNDNLGYLVDSVVTLEQNELDGRRIRSLKIDKFRGFRVQDQQLPFSLEKGRFTFLNKEYENGPPIIVRNPEVVSHTDTHYSTGSKELDHLLGGGVRKGSFLMIDTESNVSPQTVRLLINMIRANFVNQGGACFSVSTGTFSSESAAEALRPYVGEKALAERVRIVEFNPQLPSRPWRLKVRGQLMSDVAEFYKAWNLLRETSSGMMLTMNFDKLVQVYGEEMTLPGFTEMGEGLRDQGAFSIGISSRATKIREEFLRQADYHIKVESWNGHLLIYGVKPFTHIHGAAFNTDKGYPSLDLVEIV